MEGGVWNRASVNAPIRGYAMVRSRPCCCVDMGCSCVYWSPPPYFPGAVRPGAASGPCVRCCSDLVLAHGPPHRSRRIRTFLVQLNLWLTFCGSAGDPWGARCGRHRYWNKTRSSLARSPRRPWRPPSLSVVGSAARGAPDNTVCSTFNMFSWRGSRPPACACVCVTCAPHMRNRRDDVRGILLSRDLT